MLQKSKEIVLQSTGKFIEIWDRDLYQEMNAQTANMSDRVDARLGNRTLVEAHDGDIS